MIRKKKLYHVVVGVVLVLIFCFSGIRADYFDFCIQIHTEVQETQATLQRALTQRALNF